MATCAMNHDANPLTGRSTVPASNAKKLSWERLEGALVAAGEVRPGEGVACFVVAEDGVWLVLEKASFGTGDQ